MRLRIVDNICRVVESGDIHSKTVECRMGMSVVSGSVNDI